MGIFGGNQAVVALKVKGLAADVLGKSSHFCSGI